MTSLTYKQALVIDNYNYTAFIKPSKQHILEFIIIGNSNEFKCEIDIKDNKKIIDILKKGIEKQDGITYLTEFLTETFQLKFTVKNDLLDYKQTFILDNIKQNISENMIILERLDKLESVCLKKIIPLTKDMIGPCIKVSYKNSMSLTVVREELKKIISNDRQDDVVYKLPYSIQDFYDIERRVETKIPVITENQLLFDNFLFFQSGQVNMCKIIKFVNGYTILTRKYNDDVVGLLHITGYMVDVELNYTFDYKDTLSTYTETINTQPIIFCDIQDYYDKCWIIKFNGLDNVYYGSIRGSGEYPMIIKNKLLYFFYNEKALATKVSHLCSYSCYRITFRMI